MTRPPNPCRPLPVRLPSIGERSATPMWIPAQRSGQSHHERIPGGCVAKAAAKTGARVDTETSSIREPGLHDLKHEQTPARLIPFFVRKPALFFKTPQRGFHVDVLARQIGQQLPLSGRVVPAPPLFHRSVGIQLPSLPLFLFPYCLEAKDRISHGGFVASRSTDIRRSDQTVCDPRIAR